MENIYPKQVNKREINPRLLNRIEFSEIYSVYNNGIKEKKPFDSLIFYLPEEKKE